MSEQSLREAVSACSKLLWEKGWVANHDGNVTARLDDGRLLATPTAVSKRLIDPDDVLLLSPDGKLLDGQRRPGKPFSEISLHLRCYRERADAKAVVHAHPPTAAGFAVAGLALTTPIVAEAVVSLGPGAPLVPYSRPGAKEGEDALARALVDADAALLGNHGVIAVGVDVEQAFLRVELVEHLAKIELAARQIGRVNALPAADVAALLEKRTAAGLGPIARGATPGATTPSPAPNPFPPPEPVKVVVSGPPQCGDGPGRAPRPAANLAELVERIVREELTRTSRR